jgi:hypothetical protein
MINLQWLVLLRVGKMARNVEIVCAVHQFVDFGFKCDPFFVAIKRKRVWSRLPALLKLGLGTLILPVSC